MSARGKESSRREKREGRRQKRERERGGERSTRRRDSRYDLAEESGDDEAEAGTIGFGEITREKKGVSL